METIQTVKRECTVLIPGTRGENVIVETSESDGSVHITPNERIIQDELAGFETGDTFVGTFSTEPGEENRLLRIMSSN